MKLNHWLTLTISLCAALTVAAQNTAAPTNSPAPAPEAPAPAAPTPTAAPAPTPAVASEKPAEKPATKKPAAKPAKKKSTKAKAASTAKTPAKKGSANTTKFDPPVTATVKQDNVNVRGRASFVGEVITHLKKGETVTVLEEITLAKAKKDEPTKWNKILMPTNTPVWVSADLVDPNSKATLKRAHVRGGPGENFSSLAILDKGTVVKDLRKQNDWLEIETPTNTVGFVAADLLDKQAVPSVAATAPATNALPAPEIVAVATDTNAPAKPATDVATTPPPVAEPAPATTNAIPVVAPTPEPAKEEPPPKRVVNREGVVKKARNIQAPADYELHDARTGEVIDYLTAEHPDKDLKPYVGAKVVITGEEAMDARWPRTPMLKVETIELP